MDEAALHEALAARRIAGAGLDVFRREPPTGSPLLALDNVVLTPHAAGSDLASEAATGQCCVDSILAVARGGAPPPALLLNPEAAAVARTRRRRLSAERPSAGRRPVVLSDLRSGARLLARLPSFLRRPIGADEARRELTRRLATRGGTFLEFVRRTVYVSATSPYARLLRHAGCAYGDLEQLVRTDGVEGALRRLLAAGVYLTVAEFRGDQPVRRGGLAIEVDPRQLRNPLVGCDLPMQSGGSRSAGTRVGWNLDFVRDRAVNLCLAEAARGLTRRRYAVWAAPGSGAMAHLLDICAPGRRAGCAGTRPSTRPRPSCPPEYRWSSHLVRAAGRFWAAARCRCPSTFRSSRLARSWTGWGASLGGGEVPYLHARPSAVLRICEAATRRGVGLEGTEVAVGGEPITAARAAAMRRAGLRVLPRYAAVEAGLIGDGCLAPSGSDDVHVLHDLIAVVQPAAASEGGALPPGRVARVVPPADGAADSPERVDG